MMKWGLFAILLVSQNAYSLSYDSGQGSISLNSTVSGASAGPVFYGGTGGALAQDTFYWDATNDRVGIATASPSVALDIFSSGAPVMRLNQTGGTSPTEIRFSNSGTERWIMGNRVTVTPGNSFYISDSSSGDALTITPTTRNIGLGTYDAKSRLDVEGGVAIGATYSGTSAAPTNGVLVEGDVSFGSTADVAPLFVNTTPPGSGTYHSGSIIAQNAADTALVKIGIDGSAIPFVATNGAANTSLYFQVGQVAGPAGASSSIYIDGANGRVGIGGQTAPARILHINSVLRIEPSASAPASPASGDIYVDSTPSPDELCFYDGAAWQGLSSGTDANCS